MIIITIILDAYFRVLNIFTVCALHHYSTFHIPNIVTRSRVWRVRLQREKLNKNVCEKMLILRQLDPLQQRFFALVRNKEEVESFQKTRKRRCGCLRPPQNSLKFWPCDKRLWSQNLVDTNMSPVYASNTQIQL